MSRSDTRLGREVAIKALPTERAASALARQRFLQEAQAASALNHPNIVTIYDVGEQSGIAYIAMEYISGKTLDRLIPPGGMRLNEALLVAIAVADGLASAHAQGIVHRDLKPGSVIVGDDGRVKVLDFGLAKLTEGLSFPETGDTRTSGPSITMAGTVMGTASYMSPERAEGLKVDVRSDIFSFGALLYEMVTGKRAFQGGSAVATLSAVLREEPTSIDAVTENVPTDLVKIVGRCLRKDPGRRWHNMADIRVALLDVKEESESGIHTAALGVLPARKRRPIAPFVAAAAAATALAIAGAWFWAQRMVAPAPAEPGPAAVASAPSTPHALANDDVIAMVRAGVSRGLILSQIRSAPNRFDLSTPGLIRLANEKVPEDIIEAMRRPSSAPARVKPVEPAAAVVPRVEVPDGATVRLALKEPLSVADSAPGGRVAFVVADDVKAGGTVVVSRGAVATGTIDEVQKRTLFRRRSVVKVLLDDAPTADGRTVPLRGTQAQKNDEKASRAVILESPDKDATFEKGFVIEAYASPR